MPKNLKIKKPKRGFTLIELLVTISIIAILSAIAMVVYTSVMKQGRDSKRQSDLKSIQSSLEQYYADQGFYPYDAIVAAPNDGLNEKLDDPPPVPFTNAVGNPLVSATRTYINSLPQDPSDPTGSYRYKYESFPDVPECENSSIKCTGYCLYAKLENVPSPLPSPPAGCAYAGSYNFALSTP